MSARDSLEERIEALLPQTQCGRCGYPNCRQYAEAIARGEAEINRCAPGGTAGVAALAVLLDRARLPLDPLFGREEPPAVALIVEDLCIGCTKCIQACPVDAIVGAGKHMHTVIEDECTGCGLCVPACPVDCIEMRSTATEPLARSAVIERAGQARKRYEARNARLAKSGGGARRTLLSAATPSAPSSGPPRGSASPLSHAEVMAAIARGRARRIAGRGESQA